MHHVDFNLIESDIEAMTSVGRLIWDSIFKKPGPVADLTDWCKSEPSDHYVYLPNNLRKQGAAVEEFMANATYTEVLANAYRNLCAHQNIQPTARLVNGQIFLCKDVQAHHGAQHTVPGGRAARLANSRLMDFDDSPYAVAFIKEIIDLDTGSYESEAIKRRVLSKVECILMGRTSHTYNQRFIQRFFNNGEICQTEPVAAVLKSMVTDGLVLEDSIEDFSLRLCHTGLSDTEVEELLGLYEACHG